MLYCIPPWYHGSNVYQFCLLSVELKSVSIGDSLYPTVSIGCKTDMLSRTRCCTGHNSFNSFCYLSEGLLGRTVTFLFLPLNSIYQRSRHLDQVLAGVTLTSLLLLQRNDCLAWDLFQSKLFSVPFSHDGRLFSCKHIFIFVLLPLKALYLLCYLHASLLELRVD